MASKSEKYELFYSNSSVYSNFYPARFSDPELMQRLPESSAFSRDRDFRFVHVEQYMHACKALLFKDNEVLENILLTSDPMETKNLGRKVSNFVDDDWVAVARDIVTRGCWLKFSQNTELWKEMDKTEERHFVECAPRDRRWGIGLGINNSKCHDKSQWRGKNWLGQCLDEVKEHIRSKTEPELKL